MLAFLLVPRVSGQRPRATPKASPQQAVRPAVPPGLPRYDISAYLDIPRRKLNAIERVTFTNKSTKPTSQLVLHVYPRYKVPASEVLKVAKTMEFLRLSREEALDEAGRRIEVGAVTVGGQVVSHSFDEDVDTVMVIELPEPVFPGGKVTAEIPFLIDIPDKWGRWGHVQSVTTMANWYPVLAHHDDAGWQHTPFVPWHQPWYQEAGHYRVVLDLPDDQVLASAGEVVSEKPGAAGRKIVSVIADPSRDFTFVCSNRFQVWERQASHTKVRVVALPEHAKNAEAALDSACEVIPLYEKWFGPAPMEELEIVTSFFGWNGNECGGLVMIDDRVFRLPSAGVRYIDHLITHETCHQWWWNCVGTNGHAETFMDEGFVNGFTAFRLDEKYGRNGALITWPKSLNWMPTIGREDLRLSGYYGWRARGNKGPVMQDIGQMGSLDTIFSLSYDRGGKVVEMIKTRMGDEKFFAYLQIIYKDYAWKTFTYEDFKRTLSEFDKSTDWNAFITAWLVDDVSTDWSVNKVEYGKRDEGLQRVTVELKQYGTYSEPTRVGVKTQDGELSVPIWPDKNEYEVPNVGRVVKQGETYVITLDNPGTIKQVEVDPDHHLLDGNPDNNRWWPEISWRLSPLLTPMDESSTFAAYDRISVVAGPFVDAYARGGFKAAAQRIEQWRITGWAGTEPALREAIFGGQAELLNFPGPNWITGLFYEEGLYNFYNDQRHSGGRAYLRYRFLRSSSFLIDDPGFAELYLGSGNEFWAGDNGRPVNGKLTAIGLRYRLSTLAPYWDPVSGQLIDLTAEYGDTAWGSKYTYVRTSGEWGIVRSLPEDMGYLSRTRIALRLYGGFGFPDTEPYFRLGGGQRLRALDLSQNIGSSVWMGTLEWRFPVWKDIRQDFADHVISANNLFGAVFYDVGQSYLAGRWSNVVNGVGVGLRLDTTLFSFLERATIRLDIAQPLGTNKGPVLWLGLNQSF